MALINFFRYVNASKKATEELDNDLKAVTALAETYVKEETPVVTGRLRASMTGRKVGFLNYEVATGVEYAPYVEYGTSAFSPRAMMRKGIARVEKRGLSRLKNTGKFLKGFNV